MMLQLEVVSDTPRTRRRPLVALAALAPAAYGQAPVVQAVDGTAAEPTTTTGRPRR